MRNVIIINVPFYNEDIALEDPDGCGPSIWDQNSLYRISEKNSNVHQNFQLTCHIWKSLNPPLHHVSPQDTKILTPSNSPALLKISDCSLDSLACENGSNATK